MQHTPGHTHQATINPAEDLHALLMEAKDVIRKLTAGCTQGHSDAEKLANMVGQVNGGRKGFQADAVAAQALESRAKLAEDHLHKAVQSGQYLLKQLQQQAADAESKRQHLQQQQEDTDRAAAQAAAISQQLQRDVKASHEAAAAASAACVGLAAQKQELLSIKEQLLGASQRAQQMSRNLQVDAESAQESFDSHTKSFQKTKQEAAAECSKLQVLHLNASSLSLQCFIRYHKQCWLCVAVWS